MTTPMNGSTNIVYRFEPLRVTRLMVHDHPSLQPPDRILGWCEPDCIHSIEMLYSKILFKLVNDLCSNLVLITLCGFPTPVLDLSDGSRALFESNNILSDQCTVLKNSVSTLRKPRPTPPHVVNPRFPRFDL